MRIDKELAKYHKQGRPYEPAKPYEAAKPGGPGDPRLLQSIEEVNRAVSDANWDP